MCCPVYVVEDKEEKGSQLLATCDCKSKQRVKRGWMPTATETAPPWLLDIYVSCLYPGVTAHIQRSKRQLLYHSIQLTIWRRCQSIRLVLQSSWPKMQTWALSSHTCINSQTYKCVHVCFCHPISCWNGTYHSYLLSWSLLSSTPRK